MNLGIWSVKPLVGAVDNRWRAVHGLGTSAGDFTRSASTSPVCPGVVTAGGEPGWLSVSCGNQEGAGGRGRGPATGWRATGAGSRVPGDGRRATGDGRRARRDHRVPGAGWAGGGRGGRRGLLGGDHLDADDGGDVAEEVGGHVVGAGRLDRLGRARCGGGRPRRPSGPRRPRRCRRRDTEPKRRPPLPARASMRITAPVSTCAWVWADSRSWASRRSRRLRMARRLGLDPLGGDDAAALGEAGSCGRSRR